MSFRPELRPYKVLTNDPMTASRNSSAVIIQKLSVVSFSFVWTAGSSPVGTAGIQVSNDYSLDPTGTVSNTGTWTTYWFLKSDGTFVTTLAISGSSGSVYIEAPTCGAYAIRANYGFTSGSGTLNIFVCGKVQ